MKTAAAIVAVLAATAILPTAAQANHNTGPYLSAQTAARLAGKVVKEQSSRVVWAGSGRFTCPRTPNRPDYRVCTMMYRTADYGCWAAVIAIRLETSSWFRWRIWSDSRINCHLYWQ